MGRVKFDRIRMKVTIRNDSSRTLRLRDARLSSGDWTPGWDPGKRPAVAPGQVAEFRAEGDLTVVATTGTEGRVRYDVEGTGEQLYVHFNSRWAESQYANTFHVWAPPGFEAAHTGGQGHHAHLDVHFRDTARRGDLRFRPSQSGFHFANGGWPSGLTVMTLGKVVNALRRRLGPAAAALGIPPVPEDWMPLTDARQGMCGGMVFAAKDYAEARRYPPLLREVPTSPTHELSRYLRDRLIDSFDLDGSGFRWLAYSAGTYPDGDEGVLQTAGLARGRSWVTYRDEWPRIRADLLAGRTSPIGLVQTTSLQIGDNHQNLAYAYRQSGQVVDLWVYDPNFPDADNLVLRFETTDTTGRVHVQRVTDPDRPGSGWGAQALPEIRAILRMDGYVPQDPPMARTSPPPRPKVVLTEKDWTVRADSGTTTSTTTNPCGEPVRIGTWVTTTRRRYAVEISGFGGLQPRVDWRVGGTGVPHGAAEVTAVAGGQRHRLVCEASVDGLELTSGPGEEYDVPVTVTARSPDGGTSVSAQTTFGATGTVEGPNPDDMRALGPCLKSLIPQLRLSLDDLRWQGGRPNWELIQDEVSRLGREKVVVSETGRQALDQLGALRQGRIDTSVLATESLGRAVGRGLRVDRGGLGRIDRPR